MMSNNSLQENNNRDKYFVDKIKDHLLCSICFGVFERPVVLTCCGQTLCEECLLNSTKSMVDSGGIGGGHQQRNNCPMCRRGNVSYITNVAVEDNIQSMQVKCMNNKTNSAVVGGSCNYYCSWTGKLSEWKIHNENDCELRAKLKAIELLTIRVRDQIGKETYFKMNKTNKMSKIYNYIAQRDGVQISSFGLFLNGKRIEESQTAEELELNDQDQIDCILSVVIKICDQTGNETYVKIKKTSKMSKVFNSYAQRKGVQISSLFFLLDGELIEEEQTAEELELDDQDQIDCMLCPFLSSIS